MISMRNFYVYIHCGASHLNVTSRKIATLRGSERTIAMQHRGIGLLCRVAMRALERRTAEEPNICFRLVEQTIFLCEVEINKN